MVEHSALNRDIGVLFPGCLLICPRTLMERLFGYEPKSGGSTPSEDAIWCDTQVGEGVGLLNR